MINLNIKSLISVALLVGSALISGETAAQLTINGYQDIDSLLGEARKRFDENSQDAIILFDGQKVYWLSDGRLVTFVNRIVLINTAVGIRSFGDNRVPYDDARCSLHVEALRTWRDGQCIASGPTGMVETLPFAVREAYDYTNMREMMLLHDGIELPCILELAYYVEDKVPFRAGAEGQWLFQRNEPVVQSSFGLGMPKGMQPSVVASSSIPAPRSETDTVWGVEVIWWKSGAAEAVGLPTTVDAAASVPHLTWSTWENWRSMGQYLTGQFEGALTLGQTPIPAFDTLLQVVRTDGEKAVKIAELVNSMTRLIDYPEKYWWPAPRSAARTLATAYGHRLDRAILAAALFRQAGLTAQLVYIGQGYGPIDEGVASLARLSGVSLWVTGDNLEAYYNPSNGSLTYGHTNIWNRTIWSPTFDERPSLPVGGYPGGLDIRIDLAYDTNYAKASGVGYIRADNVLSPYDRVIGLGSELKNYVTSIASSIFKDAVVTDYNASQLLSDSVQVGFKFELPTPADDSGRIVLSVDQPIGGIADQLPHDVRLTDQTRASSIVLASAMSQRLEVRIKMGKLSVMHRPSDLVIETQGGRFVAVSSLQDKELRLIQELELNEAIYPSGQWADFRRLMLAAKNERNRTIIMSTNSESEKTSGRRD